MKSLLPLLLRLVRADHAALARQVEYLVVENRLLRARISGPVRLTDRERARLVRFGMAVGPALKDLISIVKYDSFRRWARGVKRKRQKARRPPGRPRTPASVEALVVRLARETGWGSARILGEPRKLGVKSVSQGTVRNILKRHGVEPAPDRRDPLWDTFLRRHAETLWACDFFTTSVLTARGVRPASVLAFIHVKSRRVIATKATFRPTRRWTADAAACLAEAVGQRGLPRPTIVVRDNDSKFGEPFDAELAGQGIKAERLPVQAPLCNAHMERWIQSLRRECPGPLHPSWAQAPRSPDLRIPRAPPSGKAAPRIGKQIAHPSRPAPGRGPGGMPPEVGRLAAALRAKSSLNQVGMRFIDSC